MYNPCNGCETAQAKAYAVHPCEDCLFDRADKERDTALEEIDTMKAKLDALVEASCKVNTMLGYGISEGQDFHDAMMKFQDAIKKARGE